MAHSAVAVLLALLLLQTKHLIFDFLVQTHYQVTNKGRYGHPGGIVHSGLHALGSLAVFLALPVGLPLAAAVIVGEFLVHYHIDWLKDGVVRRAGWTVADARYWQALGLDQFAHQITYIAMVAVLVAGSV